MDIVFVILHYTAINDTIECIDSIVNYVDTDSYRIVVVDNCSPDDSYSRLTEQYNNNKHINLIYNDENLGFAKGNNVGIQFALKRYEPSFVVVLNNDTCLFQYNFYSNLCRAYEKYGFSVLGPMIISGDNECTSNPYGNSGVDKRTILKRIRRQKRRLLFNKMHLGWLIYGRVRSSLINLYHLTNNDKKILSVCKPKINCVLHGSFLVFSKKYFNKFNGFDDRTFLYQEENILYIHTQNNNLTTLFYPGIVIYHKEDSATKETIGVGRKKALFQAAENIKSLKVCLEVLEEYERKDDEK